jgi:hypothetical protein
MTSQFLRFFYPCVFSILCSKQGLIGDSQPLRSQAHPGTYIDIVVKKPVDKTHGRYTFVS